LNKPTNIEDGKRKQKRQENLGKKKESKEKFNATTHSEGKTSNHQEMHNKDNYP
jgi:hypothetical protein